MITRTDRNPVYDHQGILLSESPAVVDVTAEVVEWDLHGKLRDLLTETRGQLQDRRTHRAELAAEIAAIDSEITAAETARDDAAARLETAKSDRDAATLPADRDAARDRMSQARAERTLAAGTLAVLRRQRRALVAAQRVERDTAEALRACRMLARLVLGVLDDTEPPEPSE